MFYIERALRGLRLGLPRTHFPTGFSWGLIQACDYLGINVWVLQTAVFSRAVVARALNPSTPETPEAEAGGSL